jgi:hypothetical protein
MERCELQKMLARISIASLVAAGITTVAAVEKASAS